jgi:hypothetical protein
MSVLLLAAPVMADIVPTEPDAPTAKDKALTDSVKPRLVELGVERGEADQIVSNLTGEDLEFFGRSPNANAIVGQQEIITMFWYEWVIGIVSLYASWKFWDTWGEDFILDRD